MPPGSRHRSAEQRRKKSRAKYDHHIQKKEKKKKKKKKRKTNGSVDDELYLLRVLCSMTAVIVDNDGGFPTAHVCLFTVERLFISNK